MFKKLYEFFYNLSKHRLAVYFMCLNSFAESIFWPIPPDVMLIPMCLARQKRAFYYALLTVCFSVLGAIIGYYLGYFLYDPYVARIIHSLHYDHYMEVVRTWLTKDFGILMVFVGAFTPIPYKVIAITCGLVAAESFASTGHVGMLNIFTFCLVSFIGRGLRFSIEAGVIYLGGERMEKAIRKYIDYIGWACVVLVVVFIVYKAAF